MASMYEIDAAMLALVDEDGEILDIDAFDNLQMERNAKIENVVLWAKELAAETNELKEEKKRLDARIKSRERKRERLTEYLTDWLGGEKFSTPRCEVKFRASEAVECDDDFVRWAEISDREELLTYKDPAPNKAAIKLALKEDSEDKELRKHAQLLKRSNIQIG